MGDGHLDVWGKKVTVDQEDQEGKDTDEKDDASSDFLDTAQSYSRFPQCEDGRVHLAMASSLDLHPLDD